MIGAVILAFSLLAPPGPPPADYDDQARSAMRKVLRDYDSARIELVSAPRYGVLRFGLLVPGYQGWFACYRVNGKNGYGGYVGWENWAFKYGPDGRLIDVVPEGYNQGQAREFAAACEEPLPSPTPTGASAPGGR